MKKSLKIFLIVIAILFFVFPLMIALLGSLLVPKLLSNASSKACCIEIGGTVSEKKCVFKDLDGKELNIELNKLEDNNGINYCTDEYFNRNKSTR